MLAGTANLGHVSSCVWSPPDVTEEVVQREQSIDGGQAGIPEAIADSA